MKKVTWIIIILFLSLWELTLPKNAWSQVSCEQPVDWELLEKDAQIPQEIIIITANTISQTELTIPSLWWTKQQFDPFGGKLVNNWLAYPEKKRIDLILNRQLWNIMDYIGRYRFVNDFGTAARQYGYNLRVFSQQKICLAVYYYNPNSNPPKWELKLSPSSQGGLAI